LIKGVLEDLEQQGEGPVVISMNPLDLERMAQSLEGELGDLDLRADQQLAQGSLRVSMDDSAIEDLLEHRLDSLSETLLGIGVQAELDTASASKFANPVTEKIIQPPEPDKTEGTDLEQVVEDEPDS
jgi:hypothetical protein